MWTSVSGSRLFARRLRRAVTSRALLLSKSGIAAIAGMAVITAGAFAQSSDTPVAESGLHDEVMTAEAGTREDPAPAQSPSTEEPEQLGETELLFDPTEKISEDLSVSFPADI